MIGSRRSSRAARAYTLVRSVRISCSAIARSCLGFTFGQVLPISFGYGHHGKSYSALTRRIGSVVDDFGVERRNNAGGAQLARGPS
jgi:hypothetical protein